MMYYLRARCFVVLGVACTGTAPVTKGSASLGIAEFQVAEAKELITIIGLDAQNQQVARLDLVHGRFVLSKEIGEPLGGTEVDGRKLNVEVHGHPLSWETMGYDDTSHMPALGSAESQLITFLADEHVRPILQKWKIGWDQVAQVDGAVSTEIPYDHQVNCEIGTSYTTCTPYIDANNPSMCTLAQGVTTKACSGEPAYGGKVVVNFTPSEDLVMMCCGSNGLASKTCLHSGTGASGCGNVNQKCAPCAQYPYNGSCHVDATQLGDNWQVCDYYCNNAFGSCSVDSDCCTQAPGHALICCNGQCRTTGTCF